ncbi:transcriptional regulator (anti-sigma factor) [Paractinoplanes abujensis]|uniref:DUF4367 domain-containing protein n=1 Tax=Paractinoplanes abujensis TaxID=882441 RepID=A0A7W7G2Y3_9ACTN|nr:hypothetical protein [Actinoplanes abujensis]MBB4694149.1 hypothetical protein [Actinoplanes abujensis]GID20637.1 transcriptional regulator (anti-sigma factor) [Actinoplanes abujensis]
MRHPNEGVLRRLVDEPAGVADTDRSHVAGCPVCRTGMAEVERDAAFAAATLHLTVDPDVDEAWLRVAMSPDKFVISSAAGRTEPVTGGRVRWWMPRRTPLVAGLAALAILAGAGTAAATDWLPIFRTERIAPVTVRQADLMALPDLSSWGDVEITERPRIHAVNSRAAAEKETGLDLPDVAGLPRGVTGDPQYQAGGRIGATFTFRAAKVRAFTGTAPPMPAGLDGSTFRLTAGPGAAALWSSHQGAPSLLVARAVAPAAYSTGVPFATARDYLLSLSGLPADVARQLRSFSADGRTLPLHVMPEELTSTPADVHGIPATVLTSTDQVLSAVLWVDDGVVTLVGGSLSPDEVLTVARGLR